MIAPTTPVDEAARLLALQRLEILDTDAESTFDTVVHVAARLVGVPIALISLVDRDRQWFKARLGIEATEVPRVFSFCGHVVGNGAALIVEDALTDARFEDNPFVVGPPAIRFYAGVPLRTRQGHVLGALCVIDRVSRGIDTETIELLRRLGDQVIELIEARRQSLELARQAREMEIYRRFFDLTLEPMATVGSDLQFQLVNPAWSATLGWSESDLQGKSILEFVHPDDIESTLDEAIRLRAVSSPTIGFVHRFRHKNGGWTHLSWVVTIDGMTFFAAARDVTSVRAKALRLRATGEVWATFSQRDSLHHVLRVSAAVVARELGLVFASIWLPSARGDQLEPVASSGPDDVAISAAVVARVARERVPFAISIANSTEVLCDPEWARRRAVEAFVCLPLLVNETLVGVLAAFARSPLDEGTTDALHAVATTLANGIQRKQIESQLQRFKTTLDRTHDAICIVEAGSLRVTYSNEGTTRMLGFSAPELGHMTAPELFVVEQRETNRGVFVAAVDTGAAVTIETTLCAKNGHELPVEVVVQHIVADEAGPACFICLMRDVSERRRIDQLQSEFISTVSHELRTPLTAIRGSLGLVASGVTGGLPSEAKEYVDIALTNSERLVRLINDILDIEKMQSGKMDFRLRCIELADLVANTVVTNRAVTTAHGCDLVVTTTVPAGEVLVDPDRFAQVLANLISNAAKFSPPGAPVQIQTSATDTHFRLEVVDRGPGIPEEFRARIFRRFAQADTSSTRSRGGTGLGLSISKAIVEQLGGQLWYEPVEDGGTRFLVELSRLPPVRPDPRGDRVLIGDPSGSVVAAIRETLEAQGLIVDVAPTIERACRLLALRDYIAIAVDSELVDGSAASLLDELPRHTSRRPPIAVVTRSHPDGHRSALVTDELGSFSPAEVERTILQMVARRRAESRRVLHVEDDEDIQKIVRRLLPDAWTVTGVRTFADAATALATVPFDAVVLDLILPDGNGADLVPKAGTATVVVFSAVDPKEELRRRVAAVLVKTRSTPRDVRDILMATVRPRTPP
ncbi:MAG: PAS domain S-box protein [Kofleriaceae bacterium]